MRISFHHVISTCDLLTLIVGGVASFTSIGSSGSSPLQAVSKDTAVHNETALATGATTLIVFTLAGTIVDVVVVAIGPMVLTAIDVAVNVFLTALLVFSMNLWVFDNLLGDSIELREFN
jgi:hypothetical protein